MIAINEPTLGNSIAEKASIETRMYAQLFGLSNAREYLLERIRSRQASVAIIGLGYVGLPLAMAYATAGFQTIGIDIDVKRVAHLNMGHSHVSDVPSEVLAKYLNADRSNTGRPNLSNNGAENGATEVPKAINGKAVNGNGHGPSASNGHHGGTQGTDQEQNSNKHRQSVLSER